MDFHSLMGRASTMMTGQRNDDGIADRLNYRYTVGILAALAIINMNRLYTDQIKCWVKFDEENLGLQLVFDPCRFRPSSRPITTNTFDPSASFRTLITSNMQIKFPN